jgi:predicted carbohydrate-binding protein with CBM5 and CBM33 domain
VQAAVAAGLERFRQPDVLVNVWNVQDTPKALIAVEDANHYGITNQDRDRAPIHPTLGQATAIETIGCWSGLFCDSEALLRSPYSPSGILRQVLPKASADRIFSTIKTLLMMSATQVTILIQT